jgi:hypothetical protein
MRTQIAARALFILGALFFLMGMTSSPVKDLRECMDAQYGVGGWTKRTGVGSGSDIGPALTKCLTDIRAIFGRGKITIPPGQWLMTNAPSSALLSGNVIEGLGSQASIIVFNNAKGVAFHFSGANGYTGGGMRGIGLLLESGLGNTNSYGIYLVGDSKSQPDQMEFNDIYLSAVGGSSYWWEGLHAIGTARTSPQGIRVVIINNMQIFNCRNVGAYISNAVQWSISNLGTYTGIGTGNDIYITGGGPANTNTIQLTASRLYAGGTLYLNNASDIAIEGKAGALNVNGTATYVSGWLHAPTVSGAVGARSNLTIQP